MSVKERDPLTGHQTTGHIWNGITELNTRVPRAVWLFVIVTHIWALLIWLLYPSWPLITTYTKGLLGSDPQKEVEAKVVAANEARASWADKINAMPADEILKDNALLARVNGTAHTLFGDNCAACHGVNATGGPGFPDLVDGAWLWGGSADAIMETLRVGINSTHPETRFAQMLAFGEQGILSREQVHQVVAYVRSLSGAEAPEDQIEAGKQLFADNCVSCHGEDAKGNTDIGAPDLEDDFWIYGGDAESVFQTVWGGRQGWMPTWEDRLTETERKIITVYLLDKGREAAQ